MAKEAKTKSFVLRIDHRILEAIEKLAADEFRSVNGQLLYMISEYLKKDGRLPKADKEKREPATGETQAPESQ